LIIVVVVGAVIAGAFFFPYDNNDAYYANHQKKVVPPPESAGGEEKARAVDPTGVTESKNVVDLPGTRPEIERLAVTVSVADEIAVAQAFIERKQGGFSDGHRLQGTWVEVIDREGARLNALEGQRSVSNAELASIAFASDGSFTEHLLLGDAEAKSTATTRRADTRGQYLLRGYTLTVTRADEGRGKDPVGMTKTDYAICPLGGETAGGMPEMLFIYGKVLRHHD
jgi:hypothetical protein